MNLKIQKYIFYGGLVTLLISFCICHFTFSYYNTLESDDYNLIAYLRDKGFFGTIKFIYQEWEGAFGVLLISLLKIKFTLLVNSLFIHNVLSCIITLYCFYYFFKAVLNKFFSIDDNQYSIALTILIYTNIYYNNLALNDSWYWLCGSIYFFMPALLLFFIGVLINDSNKYLKVGAYLYFFIYGASRFNYSVITLSILSLLLLYFWLNEKKINKTIFSLFILVFIALIIYVIAPGNYIRRGEELKQALSLKDYLIGPLKMSFSVIMKYLVLKAPYHILFLFPLLYIGYFLKDKLDILFDSKKKTTKIILGIIVFSIFCIYVQSFSMFLAKGSQRERTLEMLCIICSLSIAAIFLIIGSKLNTKNLAFGLSMLCMTGASALLLRRIYICKPLIKEYNIAVLKRHQTIESAIIYFKEDTLKLKKLPTSSWLHTGEISKRNGNDPMNNIFLEEYYKPPFVIDLEN